MKMTRTLVSYTFYYENGAPYFHTFSIGIFDGLDMIHHNYIINHDEYDFITAFERVQKEGFQSGYSADLEDGITAVEYSKSFGAD